ncbi:MAG: methionyl-tRNA formyltransferase, methionyl-tRNA formyltransferase [Candidatus Peregrinibacteria bacterium GW2011_GWF2_33_10]|nr:MAG: methionyl-tRNA formyltransferase, methionyl-tRNA formyltransferase [Candidatus Peregrinibacteria bacterium GW2011_GWF2_33_10]
MKNQIIKIVFFGTPNFSIASLKCLLKNDKFQVQALVTQTDKVIGRHKILTAPPLKQFIIDNDIKTLPIYQTPNLNKDINLINILKSFHSDFFVVVAFGQILSTEILEIPKHGCINVHASLLPKYRGASPIAAAILNGDKKTGITIMDMEKSMDTGAIYTQKELPITPDDNIISLGHKLSLQGGQVLSETLEKIIAQKISKQAQNHSLATYCSKITIESGQINWKEDRSEIILNKIKAFVPWPSCYTFFQEKKLKLLEIKIAEANPTKSPGETFLDSQNNLHIATTNGSIIIKQLQLEGKNSCNIQDFLRGYPQVASHKLPSNSAK